MWSHAKPRNTRPHKAKRGLSEREATTELKASSNHIRSSMNSASGPSVFTCMPAAVGTKKQSLANAKCLSVGIICSLKI
ncbi:unnamed protein product [Mesocestoides corti]|uniref:Uncharacterized protein n=1 Tax=Mesocestoides corti TaxID=53468 RepID=A0A0R3UE54_MESCO|nr:unnamed protein product [Mesocestoides corti]